jgi:hypothetical protein
MRERRRYDRVSWFLCGRSLLVWPPRSSAESAVMAVFPDLPRPGYRRFIRIFSASYYPMLLFSLGVAVLHLAGWRARGEFVWRRTWIAAGVFLALIAWTRWWARSARAAQRQGSCPRD